MPFLAFNSMIFLFFLIFFSILYYIVPDKLRWVVLLASSIIFYISSGIENLPYITFTALVVFLSTRQIDKTYKTAEQNTGKEQLQYIKKKCRNQYVIPTIVLIVGILCYCKFISESAMPLGISYYSFSSIAYLLDVYWRKTQPIDNIFKYMLCVSYFPQIVQGPIARYQKLSTELFKKHPFHFKNICFGIQLMLYGYFKKIVIADRLAIFTNQVFRNLTDYEGLIIVIALVFASFQLYMDFSGCMDIVRGASQIFQVELDKNFEHPFFSKSAAEFWRRWHITLGAWFKDYVFFPVVTSGWLSKMTVNIKEKCGKEMAQKFNAAVPLAIVWILTGLWHGTGWNYIAWGIYWGILIICSTIFSKQYKKLTNILHIDTTAHSYQVFQMIRTFFLFMIGRLLTALGSLENSMLAVKQLFKCFNPWIFWDGSLCQMGLDFHDLCIIILSLLVVRKISMLQEKTSVRQMLADSPIVLRWAVYYGVIFAIIILGIYGKGYDSSSFVYTNF